MKVYKEISTASEWFDYLRNNLWSGAKDKWIAMDYDEKWELCNFMVGYFEEAEALSETEINDFVWFEWEEIQEEWKNEQQ